MKILRNWIFLGMTALAFACNIATKTDDEVAKVSSTDTTTLFKADAVAIDEVTPTQEEQPTDIDINYADSIDFKKYEVVLKKEWRMHYRLG